jgi:alpha-galactosidase
VEAKGMRLGLWIPLAAVGMAARDYHQHPEWACEDLEGKPKSTGTMAGEKIVMCLASDYREAAAERIIDAVARFHLAYVKLDLTTIFNAYGEAPGCFAKGHHHGSWAESLNMIYEGISYITNMVYAQHPEVLLDITFEVWGAKHLIDAGLLAAGDLDWLSNVDDSHADSAGPRQARQLLYQRAASMPAESMLIGNLHANVPTVEESFATAIGSAPLLLGDLRKLTPAQVGWYGKQTRWFKEFRHKTSLGDSFFPLGSWQQTNAREWDGFARFARSGDGVIAVFRNESNASAAMVKLPLLPAGIYRIRAVFGDQELGTHTSADWARGIPIPFAPEAKAQVIEVLRSA